MIIKSEKGQLLPQDWKSIAKGLLITAAGAAFTAALRYLQEQVLPGLDLGANWAFLVPVISMLVNMGLKYFGETKYAK